MLKTYSVSGASKWSTDNDSRRKLNNGFSEHLTAFIQPGKKFYIVQNPKEKRGKKRD